MLANVKTSASAHTQGGGEQMEPKKKGKRPAETKEEETRYDVLGSYTGIPADGGMPVQDADDL